MYWLYSLPKCDNTSTLKFEYIVPEQLTTLTEIYKTNSRKNKHHSRILQATENSKKFSFIASLQSSKMTIIGILILLCYFIANGEFCDEPSSASDCYETDISDDFIRCPGYESCLGSSLSAKNYIYCMEHRACYDTEQIVTTYDEMLIYSSTYKSPMKHLISYSIHDMYTENVAVVMLVTIHIKSYLEPLSLAKEIMHALGQHILGLLEGMLIV